MLCISKVIGSLIGGIYLDRSKSYVKVLYVITICSTVIASIMYTLIPKGNSTVSLVLIAFFGLLSGPIQPLAFDFSVKLTTSIGLASVSGMLQMCEEIIEFIVSEVLDWQSEKNSTYALATIVLLCSLGCFVACIIKND